MDMYIQMGIALVAVTGVIILLGLFLRRRQGKTGLINILSYQSFGPRKGIAALKIGREILLIGITSTDLKLLKSLDENDLERETVRDINEKLKRLKAIKEGLSE